MSDRNAVGFLQDIPVEIIIEAGRARLTIRELSMLDRDDVIELTRGGADPLDVVVGGRVFARAQIVTVRDRPALRIVEVVGETPDRSVG